MRHLEPLGFTGEYLNAGGVTNLWASKTYGEGPHLVLAGHTDVVPTGPLAEWHSDPFQPAEREGYLFGRGAADMKSSLAAMVVALEDLGDIKGTISLLITSDEEGPAQHGTKHVVAELIARNVRPDYCIVGEPSSSDKLGDVIRCGRRGSLNATITFQGVQGHVAYPDLAENPVHAALPALAELAAATWDTGNEYYPATTFQISNFNAGTGASNVVPGTATATVNFRFNTEQTAAGLEAAVTEVLDRHGLTYTADWQLSGNPFLTEKGALTDAAVSAISDQLGYEPELSTSGGTSDGRFIAPWDGQHAVQLIELGPVNATIHKIDECTPIAELGPLAEVYRNIITKLLG